ncbi:ankyrin repeat containing protein [Colletotrichum kahawae]|uniref:Ankyrin repeat containing protein n=1 Tax=Colletotrichum kahawae TaxID=34407 RepID=A0AAD9YKV9_COLKA|nr:ankyrin repeat containing protein [Colletotrichum kahawae]
MTPIRRTLSLSPSVVGAFSSLNHQTQDPTEEDYDRVEQLMFEQREEDGNRRSGEFGHKEANPILSKLAQGLIPDATPGLAQALLDYGADVSIAKPKSTNLFKMFSGKDQVEERSDTLQHATQNCTSDILIVLAQDADEQAINEALPVALRIADPVKTSILLAKGADASPHCELFLKCVDSATTDMVLLLLRDVKGACRQCKNKGLVRAAKAGSVRKATVLMEKGADVSFQGGAALLEAIRRGKEDVALAIIPRTQAQQHSTLLKDAAKCARDHGQHLIQQACINAAANESEAPSNTTPTQTLVVVNGPSVDSPSATSIEAALMSAVNSGRLDAIQKLLSNDTSRKLSPKILASVLSQATDLPDLKMAHRLIDMLLSTDIRGDAVSDALCRVLGRMVPPANEDDRLRIIQLLLKKGRADVNARKGSAMLQSLSPDRASILRMLLQHDPSLDTLALSIDATMKMDLAATRLSTLKLLVEGANIAKSEYLQGAAVAAASRHLALDVLKYLSESITSPAIFSGGLSALTKDGDAWMSPKGLYIIQFLLDHGASGPKVDGAMARAACLYNRDAVQLLATATDPTSLGQVLSFIIASSSDWQLPANLWLTHSLLQWGCEGASVNQALINAVSAHVEGHDREHLIETLLRVGRGADVNDQGGKALQIAASRGNISLLKKLSLANAGRLALTNTFQTLITSKMDQATALGILDILIAACQRSRTRFDVESLLPDGRSLLQACISTHSKAEGLVRRLIQLGCKAALPIGVKLDGGEEWVPLLVWALLQNDKLGIAPSMLVALVEAHRDVVNFRSKSGVAPLIVAAQLGLAELIVKLLEAGAKPSDRDNTGRTALFFASGKGNMAAVQGLLKARAAPNDGSLHEAARNMHSEVIEVLIKAKHEPNFPSSLHEGRTALQELSYRSNCSNISPELEDTIRTLEKGKADPFAPYKGMNALFLALENTRPYHITKALLDIQLWRYINHDNNLFTYVDPKSSIKYAYSATMYFKHNHYRGDPSHVPHLMRLLTEKSCQDRFFAQFEPHQLEALQPAGAVGMPKAISDEDARRRVDQERRRIRDRDHADKLRHEQEEAAHRADIEGRQHQLRLERQQQTSMLQAAAAAQQAEARNARRQNQQPASQDNATSGAYDRQRRGQR